MSKPAPIRKLSAPGWYLLTLALEKKKVRQDKIIAAKRPLIAFPGSVLRVSARCHPALPTHLAGTCSKPLRQVRKRGRRRLYFTKQMRRAQSGSPYGAALDPHRPRPGTQRCLWGTHPERHNPATHQPCALASADVQAPPSPDPRLGSVPKRGSPTLTPSPEVGQPTLRLQTADDVRLRRVAVEAQHIRQRGRRRGVPARMQGHRGYRGGAGQEQGPPDVQEEGGEPGGVHGGLAGPGSGAWPLYPGSS